MIIFRATQNHYFLFFGTFLVSVRVWNWMQANAIWNMCSFYSSFLLQKHWKTLNSHYEMVSDTIFLLVKIVWYCSLLIVDYLFVGTVEKFGILSNKKNDHLHCMASKRQWADTCSCLQSILGRIKQLEESKTIEERLWECYGWRKYSNQFTDFIVCARISLLCIWSESRFFGWINSRSNIRYMLCMQYCRFARPRQMQY